VKIIAGWRLWFFPLRVGGVFHVKSVCLFVFDLFLSSYFTNSASGRATVRACDAQTTAIDNSDLGREGTGGGDGARRAGPEGWSCRCQRRGGGRGQSGEGGGDGGAIYKMRIYFTSPSSMNQSRTDVLGSIPSRVQAHAGCSLCCNTPNVRDNLCYLCTCMLGR
jgi:hypothetical protein